MDDSTLSFKNYLSRAWTDKKGKFVIDSPETFDSLKMIGMMSKPQNDSLQFVIGRLTQDVFDDYLIASLKTISAHSEDDRVHVAFLDNSPARKSAKIQRFCRNNGILLIYSIPNYPEATPIELMWRFLETPLR